MPQKTKNISNYIESLTKGTYTLHDVDTVVDAFYNKTKDIIKYKQFLFNEWMETEEEIRDICYDFIAPIFARDSSGIFYRLRNYFKEMQSQGNKDIDGEITKLIRSVIKQESVLIFASRDPFGKTFYESIQYLLKKHPQWSKIRTSQHGFIIKGHSDNTLVDLGKLSEVYRQHKSNSLTKSLDACLSILINQKNYSISIIDLLLFVRKSEVQIESTRLIHADPSLQSSLDVLSFRTLSFIEKSILNGYLSKGIFNEEEYSAFYKATKKILHDFSNGGVQESYFNYLDKFFKLGITKKDYRKKYKTRFEYVSKMAKKQFSANTKTEFKL